MNLKPMYFKKHLARLVGFVSVAVVLTSCASIPSAIPIIGKEPILNSISGREGTDGPVLVVKIDDTPAAHPQAGLEDADLVYIEQVEGGLTRLAAVYSSVIPARIGPVRSARITDIELLAQFGHVAFAYSGAQKKLLPVIASANLENMGAQRQPASIYTTDPNRVSPVAMMLRADLLMQKIKDEGKSIVTSKNMGWVFGELNSTGTEISAVKVSWPANSYSAKWSASQKRWLLEHSGAPDLAESGKELGPTTFVIQLVSITPSEYHDKVGGITPFSQTVGTGKGYVLRDSKYIPANWSRANASEGTIWTDAEGQEIHFAPGQIWIALTDKEPIFTPVIADATSAPTK
jgi:hypothetical protein